MHIREGTGGNHNEINQRPNAEATGGQQIEHSSACFAHIETVDAEAAKEKTEKEGDPAVVELRRNIKILSAFFG